jgi:hypothetical protein
MTETAQQVELYEPAPPDRITTEQIRYIANTEIVPKHLRGNPQKIVATILKGRSLGLDDMSSLTAIHIIEGKAGLAAETMVSLVRKRGHSITFDVKPGASCAVTGTRKDNGDTGSVTWTMQMAKDAGLAGKDNWKRYPDAMLWNRAVSQLCRMLFADVLMGTSYSPDELEEIAERGRVTAAVSDLPAIEEQQIRTEPQGAPSDALLNRIAALEDRAGGPQIITLRGVFGVEMASELSAEDAARYEAMLEIGVGSQDSVTGNGDAAEDDHPSEELAGDGESAEGNATSGTPAPDVPSADDEVVEAEAVELPDEPAPEAAAEESDLVEIAAQTLIPIGQYKDTPLGAIHDGWIKYGLENPERLPSPFDQAVELYAQARRPEIWKQVRG